MAPIADTLFFHSNSTYFAKAVLLTWASQLCSMRNSVYRPPMKCLLRNEYLRTNKALLANMQFSAN